jgi:hypothetical protein
MRSSECRNAIERLSAYLADPTSDAGLDAALAHLLECPECRGRTGYLVRALHTNTLDPLTCQVCEQRLPEYMAATAAGRAGRKWRAVALHLTLCPHCAAVYADLLDLVELAEGRRGVEPPAYPEPDLAFLDPPKPRPLWRLEQAGRLVIEFSAGLLRSLELPAGPSLATSGLKSKRPAPSEQPAPPDLRPFTLVGEAPDRDITIAIEPATGDPARCIVTVKVDIPSRGGWPNLRGTRVAIRRGDATIDSKTTDAFGKALFEGIAAADLPHLSFVIERDAGG